MGVQLVGEEELNKLELLGVMFVLLAILLECAVTKGVTGEDADTDVGDGDDDDATEGDAALDAAPFFNRMDLVAAAVVILMLFLTLLCEYVIVISSSSLSLLFY